MAGALAVLCSGVAMASLPTPADLRSDEQVQWQALGIAPLSNGGATGLRMTATDSVEPIEFAPRRVAALEAPVAQKAATATGPLRIRGRVGDGLYWSLRAAGASADLAAQYLAALATEIDVGEVAPGDSFDLVVAGRGGALLYAGLNRAAAPPMQLVRWTAGGQDKWVDAATSDRPAPVVSSGIAWPVAGARITSYFGYRYHPILHFSRFHAGIDLGAGWGSPIVAAADGQVVAAGWAGGYGRVVKIAHSGGLMTVYGHMSSIVADPGAYVHQGQLVGYVGMSGLATGPHLHFEVRRNGEPINPLSARFASVQLADNSVGPAVKARLKALLGVGIKRG